MSSGEVDKTPKEEREAKEPTTPTPQEQISAVAADWSGFQVNVLQDISLLFLQAYSPMPHLVSWLLVHSHTPTCGEFRFPLKAAKVMHRVSLQTKANFLLHKLRQI